MTQVCRELAAQVADEVASVGAAMELDRTEPSLKTWREPR